MASIPEKMKALLAYAPGDYRLEMVDTPRAKADEIIVKVEACGVCAGDKYAYLGAPRIWGGEGSPQYITPPVIPGHEFCGFVVEVGPDQKEFQVGDHVVSEQIVPCWECRYCKTGKYWMCKRHDIYGFRLNGGMAEYMCFPSGSLNYKVPQNMPMEQALLVEPYSCAKHCVDRANITNEDIVVQAGVGTLGLGMVGAARKRNPSKLIVVDLNDSRLAKAKEFGADIVWNPSKVDVVKEIKDMTDGYGCDVYIDASGHPKGVIQGLDMIRNLGRFVEFSVFGEPTTVDWSIIGDVKELDLLGAHLSPYCYEPVIEWLVDGSLPYNGVVSHQFSLDDWKTAFEYVKTGADNSIKVAIVP